MKVCRVYEDKIEDEKIYRINYLVVDANNDAFYTRDYSYKTGSELNRERAINENM